MVIYSTPVYGYIPKPLKERIRRICKQNRRMSESQLVERGLETIIDDVEKEMGILAPVHKSRSPRAE